MKNNIMQTINNMYKKTPSLEETELSKLESLLTQVGGDARSILLKADEYTMAGFIEICILNGITFELREGVVESSPTSETAPVSNYNTSSIQSPSEKEKSCEEDCTEAETPLTRITLDNWKELLDTGDEVISFGAGKVDKWVQRVTDLELSDYDLNGFMEIDYSWVYFKEDNICESGREYYVEK